MGFAQRCGSKYKDTVGGEMVKKKKKSHCKAVESTCRHYLENTSADVTCLVQHGVDLSNFLPAVREDF